MNDFFHPWLDFPPMQYGILLHLTVFNLNPDRRRTLDLLIIRWRIFMIFLSFYTGMYWWITLILVLLEALDRVYFFCYQKSNKWMSTYFLILSKTITKILNPSTFRGLTFDISTKETMMNQNLHRLFFLHFGMILLAEDTLFNEI